MPKLSAPLTLRQLAQELGPPWNPKRVSSLRRLRRLLVRTGRLKGVVLYHSTGQRSGHVTLAELRAHMPELFDHASEIVELVSEHVDDLKERVAVHHEALGDVAHRMARLEGRLAAVERRKAG